MYFGYILYVFSCVLMLMITECFAMKNGFGMYQNISKENEKIRPKVSSDYCRNKFSCDGNDTKSCSCDSLCKIMGDCCKGFKANRTLENIPVKSLYSCYRMPKLSVVNAFGGLVVAKCPIDWNSDRVRSLCENKRRKVEIENTYMNDDGVVFKNLFCALCNSVLPQAYSLHVLQMCANDSLDEKIENVTLCNDLYDKRAQMDSIRPCPLKLTDECPFQTENDMSENCSLGAYGIVYDSSGNMYRNTHCGLCNNISMDVLSCEKDKVFVDEPYAFPILIGSSTITHPAYENISNETKVTGLDQDKAHMHLTVITLVISILSLIITLVIYICFPILMNTPGKITFCLALSLLLAQFLFLISSETEPIPWLCITMAVLVHYFFLAAFCWMNVIAFDLWMTFANHIFDCGDKRKFYYYSVYAWLVPLVIVTLAVIFNFTESVGSFNPQYGQNRCWIFSENARLLFFIGPLALFKLFDIVAFSCTVYFIRKSRQEGSVARQGQANTSLFFINFKLSLIMGLTWTFAFLAKYSNNEVLWYMFTFFNALQGFFICVCFVCTKKVFDLIRNSFPREDFSNTSNSNVQSTTNTKSTSA